MAALETLAYAGWVPTITGHLSFSLIGLGEGVSANGVCAESVVAGAPCRYVGVSKRRVTSDLPYNGWPVGKIMPSTKAEYVIIGQSKSALRPALRGGQVTTAEDEIGVLTGEIWVIPHHDDRVANDAANQLVKQVRRLINSYGDRNPRGTTGDISGLPAAAAELLQRAERKGVTVPRAGFALFRTGEFRLVFSTSNPPWSADPAVADPIARQMFYFAKDISHRHYHHRRSTDNLLPIVPADEDDIAWRRETLWALVRSVLEARRRNRLQSYKSAVGILAYAEAFQSLLAQIRRTTPGEEPSFIPWDDATLYDFSHTRASLEATISEREFVETSSDAFKSVLIATLLGAAALWVGLLQVVSTICGQTACPPPPLLAKWLRDAIQHPSYVFLPVFLVGAFWYGRRVYTLGITKYVAEGLEGWALALGASLSRAVRSRFLGYSDAIGAIASGILIFLLGVLFIRLVAALFGLF